MRRYNKSTTQSTLPSKQEQPSETVRLSLEDHIRRAFQEKLPQLLEEELHEYLGRAWYERHNEPEGVRQYRNGYGKKRTLSSGVGDIVLEVPRLREPWESQIVRRYQRMSDTVRQTLPELYMHGLATGDFAQCLHALLGQEAPLSDSTIVRLKQQWKQDYENWRRRSLSQDYLYVWVDGVYPKAGPKDDDMALLVVVGANRRGEKEILALEEGYRESTESWRDVLRSLKRRGVRWIGMTIADGVPGFEKALRDVFPQTKRQRCWVHKMRNVLDKVPLQAQDEVRQKLRSIYNAKSRQEALKLRSEFVAQYQSLYPKAVGSLLEPGDRLFTYFDFPKSHWISIKSTNVIESIFSWVKLRTDAARRIRRRDSATYLVFQLLITAERRWHRLHGYRLVTHTIETLKSKSNVRKVRIAA
jgi:transposase-like protein